MEKIELNLSLLSEMIDEYVMLEETFQLEKKRQIYAMSTSVEYLKGDKPNMYREDLSANYESGNGQKFGEHIAKMKTLLEYANTSFTELRQECERVGNAVGAIGSGAFNNMKFMYDDLVKIDIVNSSLLLYEQSQMLFKNMMEINDEIYPIVKEDFSFQIRAGRRRFNQIKDFAQELTKLGKRVLEEAGEIISQLCGCTDENILETYKTNGEDKTINPNIVDTLQKNFGFDTKTVQLMEKVYSWIQQKYSDKSQVERDYIFLRMMGAFNYGEDGFVDGLKWNQTAGKPIYEIEGMSEKAFYVDKIGLTEAEYKYLRYKVRIQNQLADTPSGLTWGELQKDKDSELYKNTKSFFESTTGLEFNEENWMDQYNSMSGHGDFTHQMITMATILSESGWMADLYTGGEEMTDHSSGWFGDVTLNGQLGNDDYCADLDAVNIAAMMKNGDSYIDAMNKYYSEVGIKYTRAEKFVENIPLEKVESLLKGHYYVKYFSNVPIYVELEVDDLKDLAPKAYDFIKNLRDKNNTMKDY